MEHRAALTHALESLLALEPTSKPPPYEVFLTALNICARAKRQHPNPQIFEQICELLVEALAISIDPQRNSELRKLKQAPIDLLKQILQPDESSTQSQPSSQRPPETPEPLKRERNENGTLLFSVIADRSFEYDLKKIIVQEQNLRELGQKMKGDWAVIGLYGEYQNCLRVARQLLEIPDLDLPSAREGVAGLYSELKRILILVVIDKDLLYFNQRPYISKNISTQLISYLLDVASPIIVCPSDEQLQDWYFTTNKTLANPYVPRTHPHSKKNFTSKITIPLTPNPIRVISQQVLELDGDGMNNTFSLKKDLLSTDKERDDVRKFKNMFMEFINRNINDLHGKVEEVMRKYDDQFITLWTRMKHHCKNRSLPLDHIKQTLATDLKKQYSRKIGLVESDNRVRLMSQKLDSVIAELFDNSIAIKIEKVKIKFQTSERATTLDLINSPQNSFEGTLSIPNIDNRQVLTLSPDIVLALFQYQGQTKYFTININSKLGRRFNEAQLNSVPYSLMVVPGSTAQNFFAYSNTRKRARNGALGDALGLEGGYKFDSVFSGETETIIAGFYLKIKGQLVYINQSGTVFTINLNGFDKTPTKVYDSSGSPLRSFDMFLDVRVPDNEQVYVFRTRSAFVIYKADFSFFDQITCSAHQYKVINDPLNFIYLITSVQGWKFAVGGTTMQAEDNTAKREVIDGNPIVDVLQCSIDKFGSINDEDSRDLLILSDLKTQADQVLKYARALPHCKQLFRKIKVLNFKKFSKNSSSCSKQGFKVFQLLASRVPLHIASVQGPNLIPLKNGINSFDEFVRDSKVDKADFTTRCAKMLEFGLYETELLKAKELKVVAIIGRQSSGKSYLLNKIFGTRFDVATGRCTDGIWMGMAVLEGQTYVVLDCEGLLSHIRTAQDEIRMCLALAAVSDVLIFNTDYSGINQHSQKLFESMNLACDRLKGEGLFKGSLWITVRDVADNEYDTMKSEIETRIENLRVEGKFNFIMKLFGGKCDTVCLHNFKQNEFANDVELSIIEELKEMPIRWQRGSTFLDTLKMTLVQIMTDDQENQDDRMLAWNIQRAKEIIKLIDFNPDLALTHLGELVYSQEMKFGQQSCTLTLTEYINTTSGLQGFISRFLVKTSEEIKIHHHNYWHNELNRFIRAYFKRRKALALQFIQRQLGDSPNIQNVVEIQQLKASNKLKKNRFALCPKNCRQCFNVCVDLRKHDSECSCSTNHKCIHQCEVCLLKKCSKPASHTESHLCEFDDHLCKLKCSVLNCKENCSLNYKHDKATQCNCKQNHKCPVKCSLIGCLRRCNETLETPHTKHDCGEVCPYKCIFDDGNTCSSTDHFHRLTAESVYHNMRFQSLHICNKKHECKMLCSKPGFCTTGIKNPVQRLYSEGPREFTYTFYEKTEKTSSCKELIPEGKLKHEGPHTCRKDHGCDRKCPCCDVYCANQYGHPGLHDNSTHVNSVNTIYPSTSAQAFTIPIEGTEQSFVAGNSCRPETCDAYCRRMKGCYFLNNCKGGDECLQVKYPNLACHDPKIYLPGNVIYDRVRCDKNYGLDKWKSPLETKDPSLFREHIRCTHYCKNSSHLGIDQARCSELLYHTYSGEDSAHRFPCLH